MIIYDIEWFKRANHVLNVSINGQKSQKKTF